MLAFFCQLPLTKSQADACCGNWVDTGKTSSTSPLIAHAAVVYMDETGWKVGDMGCSLGRSRRSGSGCSCSAAARMMTHLTRFCLDVRRHRRRDDAAVYRGRFGQPKCWATCSARPSGCCCTRAEKLSKADQLLALYHDAKRWRRTDLETKAATRRDLKPPL